MASLEVSVEAGPLAAEIADAYGDSLPVVAEDAHGRYWPVTRVTSRTVDGGNAVVVLELADTPLDGA